MTQHLRCPQCGTTVLANPGVTPVCPSCGYGSSSQKLTFRDRLEQGPAIRLEAQSPKPRRKKGLRTLIVIGVALLVLAAGGGAAWWFFFKEEKFDGVLRVAPSCSRPTWESIFDDDPKSYAGEPIIAAPEDIGGLRFGKAVVSCDYTIAIRNDGKKSLSELALSGTILEDSLKTGNIRVTSFQSTAFYDLDGNKVETIPPGIIAGNVFTGAFPSPECSGLLCSEDARIGPSVTISAKATTNQGARSIEKTFLAYNHLLTVTLNGPSDQRCVRIAFDGDLNHHWERTICAESGAGGSVMFRMLGPPGNHPVTFFLEDDDDKIYKTRQATITIEDWLKVSKQTLEL